MNILLINPLSTEQKLEHISPFFYEVPLGVGYIASYLESKGMIVEILDCMNIPMSTEEVIEKICSNKYDIIGISSFTYNFKNTVLLVRKIKRIAPQTFLFLGGYMPTLNGNVIYKLLPQVDCMVCGEGELTVYELAKAILEKKDWTKVHGILYRKNDEYIKTEYREFCADLDKLPFPKRSSFLYNHTASIITSRGCYGTCSFCCAPNFFKNGKGCVLRYRSPRNVLEEMFMLYEKYDVHFFKINDDNFMINNNEKKEWINEFCDGIRKSEKTIMFRIMIRANEFVHNQAQIVQLMKVGLKYVFIGIESLVQRQLDFYNKQINVETNIEALRLCRQLGLKIRLGFILIDPYVTIEEIIDNINQLNLCHISELIIYHHELLSCMGALQPLSGSEFEKMLRESGLEIVGKRIPYKFVDSRCESFYLAMCGWASLVGPINGMITEILMYDEKNEIVNNAKKFLFELDLIFLKELALMCQKEDYEIDKIKNRYYCKVIDFMKKNDISCLEKLLK